MMDAKTLEALKASIAKWERNAEAKTRFEYRTGDDDCPLCELFIYPGNCEGCPVFDRTGERFCRGTPYIKASNARMRWGADPKSPDAPERAHAAARDEVAFLKSLLPEATP
jgi:hypothetical protein